jgi:antitoxin (DNA-binding transcriptional repressor) of toxin-antitoxin stability system
MKIGLGDFKARCLALIDEIHREGGQIILTKRGKEVAQINPLPKTGQDGVISPLSGVVMRPDWR